MDLRDGKAIVKTGTWVYGGTVTCHLCIVRSPVLYGSGEDEDDDREIDTYYVWYGSTTERGTYAGGSRGCASLDEAMAEAGSVVQGLKWNDETSSAEEA